MNKKVLTSAVLLTLLATACGPAGPGSTPGGRGDATTITIYAGGSSEFAWRKGGLEAEVYKAVEDAYYESTGKNLKFNVQFFPQNMKQNITTGINDGSIDVVISHMGGGDGIDDWIMGNGLYRDLTYDFEDYEYLSQCMTWEGDGLSLNARARVLTSDGKTIAIPSVINPYKFGILVRKDWMNACGYTDVADPAHPEWKVVDNYVTFEEMCLAMKEAYNLPYSISGAIYEIEKTGILGAYGVPAGYYTSSVAKYGETDITDVGGLINPDYSQVLNVESRWIQNGILPKSPDDKKIDDCEGDFIAEKTGVFLENPTVTHLIEVARMCKNANPEAEFTVLQAMTKDETSTEKGFMRNSVATFGAVITKNTKDYKDILSFVNWCYSSEANYNLCRYGVEGTHYFLNSDGTYTYPEGYSYENKPYSGILTLVENQSISDLQYAGFTQEETTWLTNANKKENYLINDTVDYMLILQDEAQKNIHYGKRKDMYNFTQNIWSGSYKFELNHSHEGHGDYTSCKIYNHQDRLTVIENYLSQAGSYSADVYELYIQLKNLAQYL